MVNYFLRYAVKKSDIGRIRDTRGMSHERLIRELEPEENEIDKRILYEMTGRKLKKDDYQSDSSFEIEGDEDNKQTRTQSMLNRIESMKKDSGKQSLLHDDLEDYQSNGSDDGDPRSSTKGKLVSHINDY